MRIFAGQEVLALSRIETQQLDQCSIKRENCEFLAGDFARSILRDVNRRLQITSV